MGVAAERVSSHDNCTFSSWRRLYVNIFLPFCAFPLPWSPTSARIPFIVFKMTASVSLILMSGGC